MVSNFGEKISAIFCPQISSTSFACSAFVSATKALTVVAGEEVLSRVQCYEPMPEPTRAVFGHG
ncbi:MAG: hypothetical protein ACKOH9_00820 [Actinomycetota bacterium]